MAGYSEVLQKYIPDESVDYVLNLLYSANVQLKITRNRNSKLGDYRPPFKVKYHQISVNHNLNPYHFLLTLIHEFAHLKTWETYGNKVKPHGKEWKESFKELMQPLLTESVYPKELLKVLKKYMLNPTATTSNVNLLQFLRKYDEKNDHMILADLPDNAVFRIHNGFVFQKLEKMRKRYKCRRLDNKKIYLVNPLVEVIPVEVSA